MTTVGQLAELKPAVENEQHWWDSAAAELLRANLVQDRRFEDLVTQEEPADLVLEHLTRWWPEVLVRCDAPAIEDAAELGLPEQRILDQVGAERCQRRDWISDR